MRARLRRLGLRLLQSVVALGIFLTILHLLALDTIDRIKSAPPPTETSAMPVSALRLWALWPVAQVLPMEQPHAEAAPGRIFRDCETCPEMVELPPAYFLIGSPILEAERFIHLKARRSFGRKFRHANREGTRRLVALPRPFGISRFELTRAEWQAAQADPDWEKITDQPARAEDAYAFDGIGSSRRSPQLHLDWDDSVAYARWLSYQTGQTYRLPTEAEWEYAARAGTSTAYSWGNEHESGRAACAGCGGPNDGAAPPEVGSYAPNAFGLYDMHGSAWEWTLECFQPFHDSYVDTAGVHDEATCEFRTVRGGSWQERPWQMRSAMRVGPHYYNRNEGTSLRLVREFP